MHKRQAMSVNTCFLISKGHRKILISSHFVHTKRHTDNVHTSKMSQNFDIVPWWLSHARQKACTPYRKGVLSFNKCYPLFFSSHYSLTRTAKPQARSLSVSLQSLDWPRELAWVQDEHPGPQLCPGTCCLLLSTVLSGQINEQNCEGSG